MEYFLDMDSKFSLQESAKYVLLPVPYDGTSTFVKGADKGPQAIIDASDSIELYDIQFDKEVYREGIYTAAPISELSSPEKMIEEVYKQVNYFIEKKKIIGLLGGEHSVSIGAIKAMSEKYSNLSVLQIDAHADLRDHYQGSPYNHACVMRRAQELAKRVVQVGIRNVCSEEKPYIVEEHIFYAHTLRFRPTWMSEAVEKLTNEVYLTIDLDGLDPSILPSTGTPLPGGLGWYDFIDFLILVFKNKKVVG
ncbi:MAG TPA: agmatinase, partial [Bacteroidales bacterium]|nr:agmatinase [Bacteroidales bacterium]